MSELQFTNLEIRFVNVEGSPIRNRGAMVSIKVVSFMTTCTVCVAFFSVILQAYLESAQLSKVTALVSELTKLEHNIQRRKHPRIAVGYGSCSDLYVGATILNFSKIDNTRDQGFLVGDITNENELLQSFAYFFNNGAAAEYIKYLIFLVLLIYMSVPYFQTVHIESDFVSTINRIFEAGT